MRSDAIDRIVSTYLKQPVKLSWKGSIADPLRGRLDEVTLTLAGVATAWIALDEIVLGAAHVEITPGLPARIAVQRPQVQLALGQARVDDWVERFRLPFDLRLGPNGLAVKPRMIDVSMLEFETRLAVKSGWFVLQPMRTGLIGVPDWFGAVLRTYLPLPPVSDSARIVSIRHAPRHLWIDLEADDLEEELTPGLADRLRERLLPFSRAGKAE